MDLGGFRGRYRGQRDVRIEDQGPGGRDGRGMAHRRGSPHSHWQPADRRINTKTKDFLAVTDASIFDAQQRLAPFRDAVSGAEPRRHHDDLPRGVGQRTHRGDAGTIDRVRPTRYASYEHTFEGGGPWAIRLATHTFSDILDDLVARAAARRDSPQRRRATRDARPPGRCESDLNACATIAVRRRAEAYFSACVRRATVRGGAGPRAAARLVAAAVVEDLLEAGRDGAAAWQRTRARLERAAAGRPARGVPPAAVRLDERPV